MLDAPFVEIGYRGQADYAMRAHVDAWACEKLRRGDLVEEKMNGPTSCCLGRGQGARHLEARDIAGPAG